MKITRFLKELPFLAVAALCAVLVVCSNAGETRSALSYQSQVYNASIRSSNIGVSLVENGHVVASRDNIINSADNNAWSERGGEDALLKGLPLSDVEIGVTYDERLAVANTGDINEYVRLIIKTYWEGPDGKQVDLDPSLIRLEYVNTNLWLRDDSWSDGAPHPETTVLYYKNILEPGAVSLPATETLTIDGIAATAVEEKVEQTPAGKIYTTTYTYNGLSFVVEVEADAVQTGHASDAMKSAWGIDALSTVLNR